MKRLAALAVSGLALGLMAPGGCGSSGGSKGSSGGYKCYAGTGVAEGTLPNEQASIGSLTATLNGTTVDLPVCPPAGGNQRGCACASGTLTVAGSLNTGEIVTVSIDVPNGQALAAGTYTVNDGKNGGPANLNYFAGSTSLVSYDGDQPGTSGTVTLTSYSGASGTTASGTFSATLPGGAGTTGSATLSGSFTCQCD